MCGTNNSLRQRRTFICGVPCPVRYRIYLSIYRSIYIGDIVVATSYKYTYHIRYYRLFYIVHIYIYIYIYIHHTHCSQLVCSPFKIHLFIYSFIISLVSCCLIVSKTNERTKKKAKRFFGMTLKYLRVPMGHCVSAFLRFCVPLMILSPSQDGRRYFPTKPRPVNFISISSYVT